MSEGEDAESKTEEASEKKVIDTLEKGNNPVSRDATIVVGFLSFLLFMSFLIDTLGERLFGSLALMLANVASISLRNGADVLDYMTYVSAEIGHFVAPTLALFTIGGLAAAFAQSAPAIVIDRILPDVSRISISKGWRRIFGAPGLMELAKAIFKICIVVGAVTLSMTSDSVLLRDLMRIEPAMAPKIAAKLVIHLTSIICIAGALLAFADVGWVRMKWRRDIRMSRQELKDEHKQAEGDPLVKSRMRSLALSRSRRRMMASVPKATMIIANPTHFAIALRYLREEGGAPLVVAKGKDLLALKIREIGEQKAIPVLEEKDLVRAMYDHVEVNEIIPPEFFRPIAEIIHFLNSQRGQTQRR